MARDVRQHGIRRTKFGIFSSGRRLMGRHRSGDAEMKLPWRVTAGSTASGKQGLLPLLGEKAWGWHKIYPTKKRAWKGGFHARFGSDGVSGGAGRGLRSRSRTQPGPDTARAGHSRSWTQPKLDAAEAGRSRSRTQPELARAGGHAKPAWSRAGWALRRVSCAGRGPGSGCAAARGRGPGAGCRRHSPGRGSAAGCAGRRLRRP